MSASTPGESIWSKGSMPEVLGPKPEITRAADIPPLSGKSVTERPVDHMYDRVPPPMTDPNPGGKIDFPTNVETEAMRRWREAQEQGEKPAQAQPRNEQPDFNTVLAARDREVEKPSAEHKTTEKIEIKGLTVESPDYHAGVLDLVRELKEAQLDKREASELLNFLGSPTDLKNAMIEPVQSIQNQSLPHYAEGKLFRAVQNGRVLAVGIGKSLQNVRVIASQSESSLNN